MQNQPSTQAAASTRPRRAIFLIGVALLIMLSAVISVYRLTVPTDGWAGADADIASRSQAGGWVLMENVMGAASELRAGDVVVAVEGIPFKGILPGTIPADRWRTGQTVEYTILRDGRPQVVKVPLVHWDVARLLAAGDGPLPNLSKLVATVLLLGLGILVFSKRADSQAARSMVLFTSILSVAVTIDFPARSMADTVDLTSSLMVIGQYTLLFTALIPPTMLHFSLVFPEPKSVILRYSWLQVFPFGFGILMIIPFALTNGAAGYYWVICGILLSIVLIIHTAITRRDQVSRAQLRWAVGGLVGGLLLILLGYPGEFGLVSGTAKTILNAISEQVSTVMGVCLAIAILRYRLFDIDLIIRRTVTYSIITILLTGVYFGGVALLQNAFVSVMGQESPLAMVISTLVIAALFTPVRRRVQVFVDRRFYRQKYDAERTLEEFSQTMRDEVDLDRMTVELVDAVEATMQPQQVSLWLNSGKS